jgi:hypothetical protein
MQRNILLAAALLAVAFGAQRASAVSVPFTEEFTSNVSGWEDNVNSPLLFEATGGPDGGSFASGEFSYLDFSNPFGGGPVIFRAHDSDNSSGDAFVGNWTLDHVRKISAWVYHETPENLVVFLRIATAFNFPGAVWENNTTVVPPFTWTEVVWDISPYDPLCFEEAVTCSVAMSNVGNMQIGTDAPLALIDDEDFYFFGIDKVRVIPEPGQLLLLASGLAGLAVLGRLRAA